MLYTAFFLNSIEELPPSWIVHESLIDYKCKFTQIDKTTIVRCITVDGFTLDKIEPCFYVDIVNNVEFRSTFYDKALDDPNNIIKYFLKGYITLELLNKQYKAGYFDVDMIIHDELKKYYMILLPDLQSNEINAIYETINNQQIYVVDSASKEKILLRFKDILS